MKRRVFLNIAQISQYCIILSNSYKRQGLKIIVSVTVLLTIKKCLNSGSSQGSGFSESPVKKIRVSINGNDTQNSVDSLVRIFLDSNENDLFLQVDLDKPGPSNQFGGAQFELKDLAFHNYLISYTFKSNVAFKTQRSGELVNVLRQTIGGIIRQIQEEERTSVRAQLAVNAIFSQEDEEDRNVPLLSCMERFNRGGDIDTEIDKCITKINESVEKYAENGSGFSLTGIQSLDIHLAKFDGDFPIPASRNGPPVP